MSSRPNLPARQDALLRRSVRQTSRRHSDLSSRRDHLLSALALLLALLTVGASLHAGDRLAGGQRGDSPVEALTIALDTLPNFAFMDDRLLLQARVFLDREPPEDSRKRQRDTVAVQASLRVMGPDGTVLREEASSLDVPPYAEDTALLHLPVVPAELPHASRLEVTARLEEREVRAQAVLLRVDHGPTPALSVQVDHVQNAEGARVLFLVPRDLSDGHRRWRPLMALEALVGRDRPQQVSLLGWRVGKGLAGALAPRLSERSMTLLPPAMVEGEGVPILHLVVDALCTPAPSSERAIVLPGLGDVRRSTPLHDYYMGLHAVGAVLAARGVPNQRILYVTPPPSGEDGRAEAYRRLVRRVAGERNAVVADLQKAYVLPQESLVPRRMERASEEAVAVLLSRALSDRGAWPVAVVPAGVVLALMLALGWLWRFSRYTPAR